MNPQQKALQGLMEGLGEELDVIKEMKETLANIERRYIRFSRIIVVGGIIMALASVLAAVTIRGLILDVHDAQVKTAVATKKQEILTSQNRTLISKLDKASVEAQRLGAKTALLLCRENERIKKPIRQVLSDSPEAARFLPLFAPKSCRSLPNRKVVSP